MTIRWLAMIAALSCTLAFATRTQAAEPIPLEGILERIGALPADMIEAKKTDGEIVDGLYLASLMRLPSEKERQMTLKHLTGKVKRGEAALDLAWALVNCKEFAKLHGLVDNEESIKLLNKLTGKWGKEKKDQDKKMPQVDPLPTQEKKEKILPDLDAVFRVEIGEKQSIKLRFDLPGKVDQSFYSAEYRYAVLDKDGVQVRTHALRMNGAARHTVSLPKDERSVVGYSVFKFDELKSGEEYYLIVTVRNLTALAKFKSP